jgi:hypothetical protein
MEKIAIDAFCPESCVLSSYFIVLCDFSDVTLNSRFFGHPCYGTNTFRKEIFNYGGAV